MVIWFWCDSSAGKFDNNVCDFDLCERLLREREMNFIYILFVLLIFRAIFWGVVDTNFIEL